MIARDELFSSSVRIGACMYTVTLIKLSDLFYINKSNDCFICKFTPIPGVNLDN